MKITIIITTLLLLTSLSSQSQVISKIYSKIDPQLKYWLSDTRQLAKEQPDLFKKGPVANPTIPIIFKSRIDVSLLLTKLGGEVHSKLGDIYTAVIPIYSVVELATNDAIIRIECAAKAKPTDTKANQLTGSEKVHAGHLPDGIAYTGNGVIIGFIDTGLDFSHADFRKKNNTTQTRILSIWDQTKNGSATPQNYNYGSEYSNTQINAALSNPNSLNTKDVNGHGTHVTGSAAGLRGMAPDADIIFVSPLIHWDSDSTLYQDTKSILDGLNYIKTKAAAAGKPCVVNLSIGYNLGSPHDGTSLVEQGIDNLVSNNSGFFVTVAAGNDNGKEMHFGGFELGQDSIWTYIKTGMLYGVFNSTFSDSTFISIGVDSGVIKSVDWENFSIQKPVFQSTWHSISNIKKSLTGIAIPALYSNGDTAMMFHLFASDFDANRTEVRIFTKHGREVYNDSLWDFGIAKLVIKGKGKLHAWWENYQINNINHPYWYANVYKNEQHRSSDDNYAMNILACGHKTISVGAFVNQPSFKNKSGQIQFGQNYDEDSSGVFAHFSSLGPTTDGRIKPDISAPGINVSSSFSRNAAYPLVWHIDNQTVALSGTSMAAPMVTGAIGLYLEKFPLATFQEIKSALTNNAIVDSLVTKFGVVPNNHFGSGRLDIYKAMGGTFHTNVKNLNLPTEQATKIYPNPANNMFTIEYESIFQGKLVVEITDNIGKLIQTKLWDVSVGNNQIQFQLESNLIGLYFINISGNGGDITKKIVFQ